MVIIIHFVFTVIIDNATVKCQEGCLVGVVSVIL